MPALIDLAGNGKLCHGEDIESSSLQGCCRKRFRVAASPFVVSVESDAAGHKNKQQRCQSVQKDSVLSPQKVVCSLDSLPTECLFEILRRLPSDRERSVSACVSKCWLSLLTTILPSDQIRSASRSRDCLLPDLNDEVPEYDSDTISDGDVTRTLEGDEATDLRLSALAIGVGSQHGGLEGLSIRGSHPTRGITDHGLSTVARFSPSLRSLSLWNVPTITNSALVDIAASCPSLEKLDIAHCPLVTDDGVAAVAKACSFLKSLTLESCPKIANHGLQLLGRCCPKLTSLSVSNCPLIEDRGLTGLFAAVGHSLAKVKLQALNISDMALAVLGYYGKAVTNLTLSRLRAVGERGFWVMASALGLQNLKRLVITSCPGMTDVAISAISKCCPCLRQLSLRKCTGISDVGLRALSEYAKLLHSLQLEECGKVTLSGVLYVLLNCSSTLKTLALVRCLGIRDMSSCPMQLPLCTSLRSLTICACPGFTDASLAVVGTICPQLEHISLSRLGAITDDGLISLIQTSQGEFKTVNLGSCVGLTNESATTLVKAHGKTLQSLCLDGCRKITDQTLLAISNSCQVLCELDLSACMVSDYGVAVLASARQLNLRVLSLAGCSKVTSKILPLLVHLGQSLVGLNIQFCNLIDNRGREAMEENLWWCDILV